MADEASLLEALGGFPQLQSAVGVARGEAPGSADPRLAGLDRGRLAELDRYAQFGTTGQDTGYVGLPSAALGALANEYVLKQPAIGRFLAAALGDPQYRVDASTSPSSFGNVKAALRGFLAGAAKR